ncbi:MAG: DoxX family membrane protein [Bacteroidota bacterium]
MKDKINLGLRVLLGLMLLVFGLNKFFDFMPKFEFTDPKVEAYFYDLWHYAKVMYVVGFVEALVGVLLIVGRFVPMALLFLAPISVNIVLFHAVLDPPNIGPALFVAALNIYFFFQYKPAYEEVLKP